MSDSQGVSGGPLHFLDMRKLPGGNGLKTIIPGPVQPSYELVDKVQSIIDQVCSGGDLAIAELTNTYDNVAILSTRVEPEEIDLAYSRCDSDLIESLQIAHDNIRSYQIERAKFQRIGEVQEYTGLGIHVTTQRIPLERIGIYVPGGRAKYPSTVLMTAIPALVAGVQEIVLCVPPSSSGNPPDETLAAAKIAGVQEIYRIGGAQAIAAMAYGTESIRPTLAIVGPGNIFVSIAKQLVAGKVLVPGAIAGPSEVVVVCDESTDPVFAAVDLAVQAEHGPDGLAWLITTSSNVLEEVNRNLAKIVANSSRKSDLEKTLSQGGYACLVSDLTQAAELINEIAPEHLEILLENGDEMAGMVNSAGVIFLGPMVPASVGDYLAGPSHVLPTNRTAKFAGALSVIDFTKELSKVTLEDEKFADIERRIATIAKCEGLQAHGESVTLRLRKSISQQNNGDSE